MTIYAEKHLLKDCTHISACYPFRGKIEEKPGSGIYVIQMKDVDWEAGIDWNGCMETTLPGKKTPEWLQAGDILFIAKGLKNYALLVDDTIEQRKAVAATQFFRIRVTNKRLQPAFLVWWLNHGYSQLLFKTWAHGSSAAAQNVPKSILEQTHVVIPKPSYQQAVLNLYAKVLEERLVAQELIDNGRRMMASLACDIMNGKKD